MKLKNIPLGSVISCIEMKPGQGAILARSAGSSAQLTSRDGKYAIVKIAFRRIKNDLGRVYGNDRFSIKLRSSAYCFW